MPIALLAALILAPGPDLNRVTADSLRAHVSFLASDALEGRGTPSRGLDIAAEYIASQFRRAGLVGPVEKGYFQRSTFQDKPVSNVIGVLPGSDPKLKDTYLLVTAHYDHLGIRGTGPDPIFNGANDDASGTAGVVEIANALRGFRPKRSIVFMAVWGEERGLLGSQFYAKNPVFPLAKTVGCVNLEQIGRTDDTEAPRKNAVSVTGADYSSLVDTLRDAGKSTGIGVERHPRFSDAYFLASDNLAFAIAGIPAHTVCTAFEFPDYHREGDHWDKLDYDNMAKVVKMTTLAVAKLANDVKAPVWNKTNPRTERFRKAQAELQAAG